MSTIPPTRSDEDLLFSHFLRTGVRLTGAAAARYLEVKFNQRHYRGNGQFARSGEGVLYGNAARSVSHVANSRKPRDPSARTRLASLNGSVGTQSSAPGDIVVVGDRDRQLRQDFDATFSADARARPSTQPTRQRPANSEQRPSSSRELGSLSAHYETGGRGASTVSSGMGRNGVPDRGGVSYGSYQMTSQTPQMTKDGKVVILRDGGNVARFLRTDGSRWANEFAGHEPGSREFSHRWRRIAQREGAALHAAEHAWVKRENYDPAVSLIKNETRLDVDKAPAALRDVLWSTAVQHGAGSVKRPRLGARRIFIDAINQTDLVKDRNAPDYYETLIRNIYVRRTAFWPSDRPRYRSELQNALHQLSGE